ncbi:DUF3558 domain-containing protein [Goodfellowiella coeruleoviolacea]|uniref:DUF3558 domain-containing protein n=1 Tax=Goodfellowiella coeruleoviolacea TaxID=334858 RepID=UPI0020A588EE|nr:DUF3558 domain-containing protein [Goodfellowiella coeruleoviolacea]
MQKFLAVGVSLLGAVALAGCSGGAPGAATTPTGATTKTSATSAKPNRPQELKLSGKQPCELLPQQEWAKFFIEKQGKARENENFGGPECYYSNDVGYFDLHLNPSQGIEYWTEAETSEKIEYVDPVKGFPAVERGDTRDPGRCDVIVDVADGQYLRTVASIDKGRESQVPPRCELAHQLAEVAVTTLMNGN